MNDAPGSAIRIVCLVFSLLTSLAVAPPVFAQGTTASPGVQLQAAIEKEDVEGDLKSAMDIYQRLAADTSAPRDVRARALLRLAGCDEKLGRQATQVYQQILHSYPDLPAAAHARAKLASIARQEHPVPPPSMSVRKLDTKGVGPIGVTDTDGQRAIFEAGDGNLYIGDLGGHNKRLVYKPRPGQRISASQPRDWVPSRDLALVALLLRQPDQSDISAVVRSDGTGYRELLRLDPGESITRGSWSWDDRNLLLSTYSRKTNTSRLWGVSVADGRKRELASMDNAYVSGAFSPDGRFVAYEIEPRWFITAPGAAASITGVALSGTNRIFVVPVQGGEPKLLYESNPMARSDNYSNLLDWTADGRYLSLKEIHGGRSGLYLLPMKDGVATGDTLFVRFGDFIHARTTASGALVYSDRATRPNGWQSYLAPLDPEGHPGEWKRVELRGQPDTSVSPSPTYSPDGSEVAYLALGDDANHQNLVVLNPLTGKDRVIYTAPKQQLLHCLFSIRVPKVFCSVQDNSEGNTKFIAVDAATGAVEQIATFPGQRSLAQLPHDETTFRFLIRKDGFVTFLTWNRTTQQETVLLSRTSSQQEEVVSDDGLTISRRENGTLSARPSAGGDWKPVLTYIGYFTWDSLRDGSWNYYVTLDPAGKRALFRVPCERGVPQAAPQRMADAPDAGGSLRVRPDGRMVFLTGLPHDFLDISVLENFEPAAEKK